MSNIECPTNFTFLQGLLLLPGTCIHFDYTVYPKKYAHGFCFAVLCCGYTLTDFPISIRLTSLALWQTNDCPVPAKQPWWIWINTSCEFIMNDCITTTKQSTTKPCAYFLGYTVYLMVLGPFLIRFYSQNTKLRGNTFCFLPLSFHQIARNSIRKFCHDSVIVVL